MKLFPIFICLYIRVFTCIFCMFWHIEYANSCIALLAIIKTNSKIKHVLRQKILYDEGKQNCYFIFAYSRKSVR